MKALKKVKFDGVLIADHIPRMITPPRTNTNNPNPGTPVNTPTPAPNNNRGLAYSIGYIKSLRDRVEAEAVKSKIIFVSFVTSSCP